MVKEVKVVKEAKEVVKEVEGDGDERCEEVKEEVERGGGGGSLRLTGGVGPHANLRHPAQVEQPALPVDLLFVLGDGPVEQPADLDLRHLGGGKCAPRLFTSYSSGSDSVPTCAPPPAGRNVQTYKNRSGFL